VVLGTAALAHSDDPKVRDRQPPYVGPGYRLAIDGPGGIAGGFASIGIELYSWLPLAELDPASVNANSCFGYVSPSGREYAIIGINTGTVFVEVTDPANAQRVAFVPGPVSLWRDVRTYSHYNYSVSEGGRGIQVMDLANIDGGSVTLVREVSDVGTGSTHTLEVDQVSGFLYRAGGGSNGLRIYSLADPANPTHVGSWSDKYVHECQVVTYTSGPYAGRQIAFICGGFNGGWSQTGLDILDVTNKSNIFAVTPTLYWPEAGYSHQICLSPDRRYAYLNDELDEQNFGNPTETQMFNVEVLESASRIGIFTNNNTAIGHNLYTKNNLIFESNYRSGLRVFDASNPTAPVEIAWFDTYPEDDAPNFNGLWNNYPYLPSGTIIGSDIERGLFVWRLGPRDLDFSYPDGLPEFVAPSGANLRVRIAAVGGASVAPGSATLHVNVGAGWQAVPLVPLGGDIYNGAIPASVCGAAVRYYVSADTNYGVTLVDPYNGAAGAYGALSGYGYTATVADNFETDTGWTVANTDLADGAWERGVPAGDGSRGDPPADYDGSGQCYLTGNRLGNSDVDGGPTRLTSPRIDLSAPGQYRLRFAAWFYNDDRDADRLTVEISNDDGAGWSPVANLTHNGQWTRYTYVINDLIAPSAQMRVRFSTFDNPNNSLTEAAVDAFEIFVLQCTAPAVRGDLNCDGSVNNFDIDPFVLAITDRAAYAANYPGCDVLNADINGDGSVNNFDIDPFVACVTSGGCP
jgi:choice-of-anchor B domain-containing protein